MYNYYEEVKKDAVNAIMEILDERKVTIEEVQDELYDILFLEDSVTGNASGSYTFNTWQAEENLAHNWDLINEAYEEFGSFGKMEGPEAIDVAIRCYVLAQVLDEAIEEVKEAC